MSHDGGQIPPQREAELKLGTPGNFTGEKAKAQIWLSDCLLYLGVNRHIYNTDEKKVTWCLSFIKGGAAEIWKYGYVQSKTQENNYTSPSWTEFQTDFKAAWFPTNLKADAIEELENLSMIRDRKMSVDEYISKFKALVGLAELSDDAQKIRYFARGLKPALVEKIALLDTPPTTVEEWYTKASTFESRWRQAQNLIKRAKGEAPLHSQSILYSNPSPSLPQGEPMDIDKLSVEDRARLMKEGKCFRCQKRGHRSRECPNRSKGPNKNYRGQQNRGGGSRQTNQQTKKPGYKDLIKHIHELGSEDLDKFWNELDEEIGKNLDNEGNEEQKEDF